MILSAAQAAPRAESALECGIAADMAVVAHSLAQEHIQRPQADAIMVRIYDVSASERGKQLMRDIMDAAYRTGEGAASGGGSAPADAQRFAEDLFSACMQTGGDRDPMLGQRS